MVSFVFYDIVFLVAFTLAVILFLYTRRSNLKRQGLLYLYRTKVGLKIIDWTSKKFSGILKPLQYLIIASGYTLMALMLWVLVKFSYIYLASPTIAKTLKVPVLLPLIPYIDKLVPFLPPFYFTYWIIIIAIIAIPHEFAHGIFARLNKIKVHSTGFGFLGPFLAAFVEPDEKEMAKMKKFPQLAILAAGTFANILVAVLFTLLLWLFFISSFTAAGVNFTTYSTSILNTSDIQITGVVMEDMNLIEVRSHGDSFFTSEEALKLSSEKNLEFIAAYDNTPALNARLSGAITSIDGTPTTSFESLSSVLQSKTPGDEVIIQTIDDGEIKNYEVILAENEGKAFLGIGIAPPQTSGISGKLYSLTSRVKDPSVYYESSLGNFGIFIYDLLWWTILISLSVALVNMIPVGIFDGGRFFFLTIWGITGSEKIAKRAFSISTLLILFLVAALMVKWLFAFFLP